MKKMIIAVSQIFILALMLCSCVNHTASGPGNVIEPHMKQPDLTRIVTFNVIGKGVEPDAALNKGQAILMAERAAVADGYRQFVEKLRGVFVDAYLNSGFGEVQQDVIKLNTQSWLRGVELVEIRPGDYGIVQAHMQLRINFAKKGMVWWPAGLGDDVSALSPKQEGRQL